MLGGCGNEGKLVTSQYFTTLQQMRVWICCIYQCIARVESKGTHRSMNPSKQRVEGNWGCERMKTEDPPNTKWTFQGQPSNCGARCEGRSLHKLLPWLSISVFWENVLRDNIKGTLLQGLELVKRCWVGSFKKNYLATYCFQRVFSLFLLKQQHCFGYRSIYSSLHSSLGVNKTVS